MDTSFYTAARGVRTQQERMNVLSNNIANLNTMGYKMQSSAFLDLMYYNMRAPEGDLTRLKAGTGVMQERTDIDFSATTIVPTELPLDYGIIGEGFFMLRDPASGEISYTRNGHFSASQRADGMYLITDDGKLVLDANRNPIRVVDREAAVQPGVFTFVNTNGMLASGDNEFTPVGKNGAPILVTDPNIRNGYLEMSNVDLAEEYAKVIESSRAYSYALKMVQTSDEVEQTINSLRV